MNANFLDKTRFDVRRPKNNPHTYVLGPPNFLAKISKKLFWQGRVRNLVAVRCVNDDTASPF